MTQHAHRWETFTYSGHHPFRRHSLWSGSHLPLLAELDLNIDAFEQELSGFDLHCFKDAPRLCALTTADAPTSMVPYHQLRHLKFQNSNSGLVEMLQRCPSVKSLELQGWEGYHTEYSECYPSRNITSLAIIIAYHGSYLDLVLWTFSLPSLNMIVLHGYGGFLFSWPTETFISFISRSSSVITMFTLRRIPLSDLDLITALHVMPSLLHLEIEDYKWGDLQAHCSPITSNLISSLIQHESTSISLVPKLHTLRLVSQRPHTGTFNDSAFVSMVESRWFRPGSDRCAAMSKIGRSCIRSVILKFDWREVDAEVYKPLRILDKEGLRVVVSGTNGIQV